MKYHDGHSINHNLRLFYLSFLWLVSLPMIAAFSLLSLDRLSFFNYIMIILTIVVIESYLTKLIRNAA